MSLYVANVSLETDYFSDNVGLPAYAIIPGALVIFSIWAITRSEAIKELPKKSLIFLSASFICWFIAEQSWNLYEHVLDIDPYPSVADLFYISAPIFMFIALWIFLKSTKKKISKKKITFASIISLLILVPSLISIFEEGFEDELLENFVALSYPISDSILLFPAIIIILFLISSKRNFFWLMIISGIIIFLVADTVFLFLVIHDMYEDGHPVDLLWISSYTIWATMMFYIIYESKRYREDKEPEVYEKYGSKKIEKYGVHLALIFINITVILFLWGSSQVIGIEQGEASTFFFWFLIMMIVIFSSTVVLLNSRLNKTLLNRTTQLERTSEELIKAERFSAIGEVASRISHDIRNPLSNVKMSIELMKNSPPDTKIADKAINEKLEVASKNIERISHQVNDVLEFVKNRELKRENVRVSNILHDTVESMQIPSHIRIKMPKSDISVFVDLFQLQIVFNNIILNAIQAIGKDNGEILIKISEKNDKIIIRFEDSGPNIPENIINHIFDTLVTTKQVGTGLGLVSCKTIIENHKGEITVQNDPVTFTIILPDHKI
jgi:signal transduction histidine kinase